MGWLSRDRVAAKGEEQLLRMRVAGLLVGRTLEMLRTEVREGVTTGHLDALAETGAGYGIPDARPVTPDRWLDEGDQVSIGDLTFDILHCPGHSPGSVVFFNKELRFAHVGDVLFAGSVGRTDLPGGSHPTLIQSIKQKLLPLGDDVGFICGHGAGSSIGQERMTNPFITGEM